MCRKVKASQTKAPAGNQWKQVDWQKSQEDEREREREKEDQQKRASLNSPSSLFWQCEAGRKNAAPSFALPDPAETSPQEVVWEGRRWKCCECQAE